MATKQTAQTADATDTDESEEYDYDPNLDDESVDADGVYDMGEYEEVEGFPVYPKGVYRGATIESEYRASSTGKDMVAVVSEFLDPASGKTFRVFDNLVFDPSKPDNMGRTRVRMKQYNPNFPMRFSPRRDAHVFAGRFVEARVGIRKADKENDRPEQNTITRVIRSSDEPIEAEESPFD